MMPLMPTREPDFVVTNASDGVIFMFFMKEMVQWNTKDEMCYDIKEHNNTIEYSFGDNWWDYGQVGGNYYESVKRAFHSYLDKIILEEE